MYNYNILDNGIRIISIPQKEIKSAAIFVLVKAGSRYETKEISGISHFLEHLFFKGTSKMKKPKDVAEFLDKVGGSYNAFTGSEITGYYAKTGYDKFDLAIDWVSDIFINSKFPPKEIEKERGVIIEEINMYNNNPIMHIDQVWKEVLYGDQPAGWDIGGTKESVLSINRQQIMEYAKKRYRSENIVICIAGNYDEEKSINKIKEEFSIIKKGKAYSKDPVINNQTSPRVKICYKKIEQTNLIIGFQGYGLSDERRHTLNIISAFLGGMMSSRLYGKIVEEMGAAYYINTSNSSSTDIGDFSVSSGVDNKKVFLVIESILKEFKNIKEKKIKQEELQKAKDYIKGRTLLGFESIESKVNFYASQELFLDKITPFEEVIKKIEAITVEDVKRVANETFTSERLNLALIGPFKNKKEFLKLLSI